MADFLLLLRNEKIKNKIPRYLRDYMNPLDLSEEQFISRYRLTRESYLYVCDLLESKIKLKTSGHTVEQQVLMTLSLLASGSFQGVTADSKFSEMSQSSVSRSLGRVTKALVDILPMFIKFPSTDQEKRNTRMKFFEASGFPRLLGIIDGTHIPIQRPPSDDWFMYINRKSIFSINVQLVCDKDLKISNVVARWPGSVHDAYIWAACELRRVLTSGTDYLIGDAGYPLEPWLLKPYDTPTTAIEENFNKKLRSLRSSVERCNGVLKSRFRCLHKSGGNLLYSPSKSCQIIMACCVLHNICIERNIPLLEYIEDDNDDDEPDDLPTNTSVYARGCLARSSIAQNLSER
ncbi:putative nuclease HARBI1 [Parasteatoda tepidariorum]|uniref:putative nuclease HARBI1 n=1 Tax=Parasteatoda tepidariorum TaxID=114398 RepID=UPI001C719D99|nr:putative nuclease HARBI1 [Parasteatoda tepidariorum]